MCALTYTWACAVPVCLCSPRAPWLPEEGGLGRRDQSLCPPRLSSETPRSLLIYLFDNSLISCLFGRVRAPTYQLRGRRDGFAWRNLIWFFLGKEWKKKTNTQEWTIMDLKIEGGGECSVGEERNRGVCLSRAALPFPPEVPKGLAASLPGEGARGREGKWGREPGAAP